MKSYIKHYLSRIIRYISYWTSSNRTSVPAQRIHHKNESCFGGYYDVEVLRNNQLLYVGVNSKDNYKTTPKEAKIYIQNINGETQYLSSTTAVNWQLGSRLQWIDDNRVFYLDHVKGKLVGVVLDLVTRTKTYEHPWWLRDEKKQLGIILDFSKILNFRPGYGYNDASDIKPSGLQIFHLYEKTLIFSLTETDVCNALDITPDGYFNHAVINSTGELVLTTYNVEISGDRITYPVLLDLANGDFQILKLPGIFSHPTFSDENIIYFCGDGYVSYNLFTSELHYLLNTKKDGHPTVRGNLVYTDTYPDRLSRMQIYRFDKHNNIKTLCKFTVSPKYYGDHRCDLHPKINQEFIIYDRPLSKKRCIELIKVNHETD